MKILTKKLIFSLIGVIPCAYATTYDHWVMNPQGVAYKVSDDGLWVMFSTPDRKIQISPIPDLSVSNCSPNSNVKNIVWQVNTQAVRFTSICKPSGLIATAGSFIHFEAKNKEGNDFLISELNKMKSIRIGAHVYSSKGYSSADKSVQRFAQDAKTAL